MLINQISGNSNCSLQSNQTKTTTDYNFYFIVYIKPNHLNDTYIESCLLHENYINNIFRMYSNLVKNGEL